MFKKLILILLVCAICLSFSVACNNGQGGEPADMTPSGNDDPSSSETPTGESDPYMGDVNGDGEVNEADLALFRAYLEGSATEILYEHCDLDANYKVNSDDADILEKYLSGEISALTGTPFARADRDVTNSLEDLGINNAVKWSNSSMVYIVSRNPYDMIVSNGLVMVSCGNYQDNTGPVVINGYGRDIYEPVNMGTLDSEQINRFYDCGDFIATLSIDARTWQYGDIYLKPADSNKWVSRSQVLVDNIHCYDMIEYNGTYFFCGSNVSYKTLGGRSTELSKASIFVLNGELSKTMKKSDFSEVKVIDKHGNEITYDSIVSEFDYKGEIIYYSRGVPRFYEFFKFGDTLYAFYYDASAKNYGEEYNYNGLYRYDDESGCFIFDKSVNADGLIELIVATAQDAEKIQHDFEWGDRYYFVKNGLYYTEDFVSYSERVIPGYEDYRVHDVIFRGDKAYVLAAKEESSGDFINAVFETSDFESFRTLFHFEAPLFARSFELCNGEFYFGLGFTVSGADLTVSARYTECGRIYRYTYYR